MALLHAIVANNEHVLAEASSPDLQNDPEAGNTFSAAVNTILRKIPPNDSKLSYQLEDHLCHYIRSNGVTVMVMADQELARRVAFGFLNELLKRFNANYSNEDIVSAPVYGMASEFNRQIEDLMSTFSRNPPADPIKQAQEEIGGVKQIMVQNIEQILARGERIELLVDKTDNMSHQARAFRKRSQALRRRMWYRNVKLLVLSGTFGVILLFLLIQNFRH
ncbi:VAMP/synaptobrevin-like protein [Cystobasidium minutum MCA 4210]|uniref:VAMP/synaptobrevin-like protein n=1 Tax=Cystobasidium minutum MCA 4210 TaxID=1397322 RepID=UPI0034CDDD91|eukprot:jgi/Rhomi1/91117/CE91116_666